MAKINGVVNHNVSDDEENFGEEEKKFDGKQKYTLPGFRYTNIFTTLVIVDGIMSCILWLTGKWIHWDVFTLNKHILLLTVRVYDIRNI